MGLRILVDENSDGFTGWLRQEGYEVESVRELKEKEPRMGHDYNMIKHAHENGMVLITRDAEVGRTCLGNGIKCVPVDEGAVRKLVLSELEKLGK